MNAIGLLGQQSATMPTFGYAAYQANPYGNNPYSQMWETTNKAMHRGFVNGGAGGNMGYQNPYGNLQTFANQAMTNPTGQSAQGLLNAFINQRGVPQKGGRVNNTGGLYSYLSNPYGQFY